MKTPGWPCGVNVVLPHVPSDKSHETRERHPVCKDEMQIIIIICRLGVELVLVDSLLRHFFTKWVKHKYMIHSVICDVHLVLY